MSLSRIESQRSIFERSQVGVIETSLQGEIRYANRYAVELLELESPRGSHLRDHFEDAELLEEQLRQRSEGLISTYRANLVSRLGRAVIPLHFTSIPLCAADGRVIGAVAVLRHPVEEDINRLHQETEDGDSLLYQVAGLIRHVVPYDVAVATRYSDDCTHSQPFFIYRPDATRGRVEWNKRWEFVPESLRPHVRQTRTLVYNDLQEHLRGPALEQSSTAPLVRLLRDYGVESCLRRAITRRGRLIATLSFFSRKNNAYSEEHQQLVDELPVGGAVLQAISHFDRRKETGRFDLLRELSYCGSAEVAAECVARRVCEIFAFDAATLWRIDHASNSASRLNRHLSRRQPSTARQAASLDPTEREELWVVPLENDAIARAAGGEPQEFDLETAPEDLKDRALPDARAVLCWPISIENEGKVRWVLVIEDHRANRFSSDERVWLGEIAHEVGGFLQRLSTLNFLADCFEATTEPMVVVDSNSVIKRVNPAAASLFGAEQPQDLRGPINGLFCNEEEAARALRVPDGSLGEFHVRRFGNTAPTPVDVSKRGLSQRSTGGAIFSFRDTRPMRRLLELQWMERAAYEIALEARTPISLVMAALERSIEHGVAFNARACERALQQLARANHAFTKLAMYNSAVRDSRAVRRLVDVIAEARALHDGLPGELGELVQIEWDGKPAEILADRFQVVFVLETVLMFFARCAPEDVPVILHVFRNDGRVHVTVEGFLPGPSAASAGNAPDRHDELRLALPILMDYLAANDGNYDESTLACGKVRYLVNFNAAETEQTGEQVS